LTPTFNLALPRLDPEAWEAASAMCAEDQTGGGGGKNSGKNGNESGGTGQQ
jgi:hypothetical protein